MNSRQYRVLLVCLSLLGMTLVWLATATFGPGLSTDGARYLSTAESLLAGRGLLDYFGRPLTNWPPLYPLLLAATSRLLKTEVLVSSQILNVLCFGAIILLSGRLFERSLPSKGWAAAASLLVASSLPFIEVSANIASDPLFAACLLGFLLVAQGYVEKRQPAQFTAMVALAIASTFLRYAGVLLIAGGALLVLLAWRPNWPAALARAASFGLAASAPIAAWALLFNLPNSGTLLGTHRPAEAWTNFLVLFEKIGGWFVPLSWTNGPAVALVLIVALAGLLAAGRKRIPSLLADLQSHAVLPSLVMFLVYAGVLIFTISTSEHRVPGSQRLHVLLLPMFLVLAFTVLQRMLPQTDRRLLLTALAFVMLLPVYRVQAYVRASLREGDVSFYNLYNTRTIRQSDIVAYLQSEPFEDDVVVYSNNEAAAWFYLRQWIRRLPRYEVDLGEDAALAIQSFAEWPKQDEQAVLIWFERDLDYKDQVPTPDEMAQHLVLRLLFTGRYGDVYSLGN
ncbi:MAG: glycosyltransferase family 39 protein [Anaerolineales bacterium]|nr:glycosyltransferase family 39 protein [Anaerolineales bacterium]MCW5854746.1 glycosyltransferase family 39 protein [Anaerolineales bacterium]